MRYLIFTNTPAHVHLYRNLIDSLQADDHDVLVLGREYGCTKALLEHYDIPFEMYGRQAPRFHSLVTNVPSQFASIFRKARAYDPDVIFGRGAYAAFAGAATGTSPILVLDSEPWDIAHEVSSRFARTVLTPSAFEGSFGSHHFKFDGVTECAYLHPDVHEADASVRSDLGIGADEPFSIVRFNAADALHDVGLRGGSRADSRRLVDRLSEHGTVFVSDEGERLVDEDWPARPYDLHPSRIHDALAEAALLVTDTGTMATEAGLLGTPAVRFVDEHEADLGEFRELERHGLVIQHTEFEQTLETAERLLTDDAVADEWQDRRQSFFRDTPNLTRLLRRVAAQPEHVESLSQTTGVLHPASPH